MPRWLEIPVTAAAGIVLLPVALVVALLVLCRLGPPVLFVQERTGLHGRPFRLVKFRTMRVPAPGEDPLASDAARMTRIGRFLRSTSLDELPSLWNVLRGDMALVGPRPLLPEYLPRYTPEQMRRHEVRPGITGWAQVNGRNAIPWEEKFRLDVWYVDHRSLALDCRILRRTIAQVVRREGVTMPGSPTAPPFMGSRGHSQDPAR